MALKYSLLVVFLFLHAYIRADSSAFPWTNVYHRAITPPDFATIDHKKIFTFTKEEVPPFTQLMMSWNSVRPDKGHFSFYGQLRDKQTKKWGSLHQMIDWGKKVQKSYSSKSDGMSANHHVRLEMNRNKIADGFKIKIVSKEDADLKDLKGIAVTTSNFSAFKPEDPTHIADLLPSSVEIQGVPSYSQFQVDHPERRQLCSPTSCAMLIDFLMKKRVKTPKKIAKKVYDEGLEAFGSWPFNTAYVYECCNQRYWIFSTRLNSFVQLYNQLKRGLPVIVSVQGRLFNAPRPFTYGHLMVVVGYDKKTKEVIVRDPAFATNEEVAFRYPLASFLKAWERRHRLVYWLEPKK